jgi:hypothetical protein
VRQGSRGQPTTCVLGLSLLCLISFLTSCGNKPTPLQDEAQQIVQAQQHIASVSTMTSLLRDQQSVEATATAVVVGGQQTATATTAQIAVRATQEPIIAAATIAAAEGAAKIQATTIVEAAQRAQVLAGQATATAQVNFAKATADTAASQAGFIAWKQRRDAAAHYIYSCAEAMNIADRTTSVEAAIAAAQREESLTVVGYCPDPSTPTR